MKIRRRALPALTLLAAAAIAACSGGTTTQPTVGTAGPTAGFATDVPGGGAVGACALLTAADIEAVTGEKVRSSEPGRQFGTFEDGCEWVFENLEFPAPAIQLGVLAEGGRKHWDDNIKPYLAENGQEPVAGVGDDAATGLAGSVWVVSGDAYFNISYRSLSGDDAWEAIAAELGKKVVANLGS